MSHVCNVIVMSQVWLSHRRDRASIAGILDRVWTCIGRDGRDTRPQHVPREAVGGTRALEVDVLVGAYNYLDIERFLRALHAELGESASEVQVAIQDQHDERFTLYRMDELGNHFDMEDV